MALYSIYCPKCGNKKNVREMSAGTITECPLCQHKFQVPEPDHSVAAAGVGLLVLLAGCGGLLSLFQKNPPAPPQPSPGKEDRPVDRAPVGTQARLESKTNEELAALLSANHPLGDRLGAIELLGQRKAQDPMAISRLIETLTDHSPQIRRSSARALAKLDVSTPQVFSAMLEAVDDTDKGVQKAALDAVATLPLDETYLPTLTNSVKNGSENVRLAAVGALTRIGIKARPTIIPTLGDPHNEVRVAAREALRGFDKYKAEDIPTLVELLKHQDAAVREYCLIELRKIPLPQTEGVKVYVQVLSDKSRDVRLAAIAGLETFGQSAKDDVVGSFLSILRKDQDEGVRHAAGAALKKLGRLTQRELPELRAALNDEDGFVREYATRAIGQMASDGQTAVPDLALRLRDSERLVRLAAIDALGMIDAKSKEVNDALILVALEDQDTETAARAALTVETNGQLSKDHAPQLMRAVQATKGTARINAVRLLGAMGSGGVVAVVPLLSAAKDPSPAMRQAAIKSLGRIGAEGKTVVPLLIDALKDDSVPVRRAAVEATGHFGPVAADAVPSLISALKDKELHTDAVAALKRLGSSSVPGILLAYKKLASTNFQERADLIHLLGEIGPKARSAEEFLIEIKLYDMSFPGIRKAADESLKKIRMKE